VNIYGDLDQPAGIEAGVYRKLLGDSSAENNCINLLCDLLGQARDRETIRALDRQKDLRTRDGLAFEITPPSAEDAYTGWWVSVYSEQGLNRARASNEELKQIAVPKAAVGQGKVPSDWSADEIKLARQTLPVTSPTPEAQRSAAQSAGQADWPGTATHTGGYGSRSTGGGSVYVRAYYRKDGTYVHSHTRGAPSPR
jgi:hypothetical protein